MLRSRRCARSSLSAEIERSRSQSCFARKRSRKVSCNLVQIGRETRAMRLKSHRSAIPGRARSVMAKKVHVCPNWFWKDFKVKTGQVLAHFATSKDATCLKSLWKRSRRLLNKMFENSDKLKIPVYTSAVASVGKSMYDVYSILLCFIMCQSQQWHASFCCSNCQIRNISEKD